MKKGKIYVIGTSHIAKQSVARIKEFYAKKDPEIIAVELDHQRFLALLHKQKPNLSVQNMFHVGFQGYMFMLIGNFIQKKLGKIVGLQPGADMLAASKLAMKDKKRLLLIDRDIGITLKRFSKKFSWKEKFNIVGDIFKGLFSKKKLTIDLNKVPESELIDKLLGVVKKSYPNAYKVLIDERNEFMAKRVVKAHKQFPEQDIMVVVGAGHKKGMLSILKKLTKNI